MTLHRNLTSLALAGGTAFALCLGSPAAASPVDVTVYQDRALDERPMARVFYGDLNLAANPGVETLQTRVRGAIRQVCAGHVEKIGNYACRSYARKGAEPQIARAIQRAEQIAVNGFSDIAPVAIAIVAR